MTLDPNDFLMGGGTPAFSFGEIGAQPGTGITGKIRELRVSQQTKYKTGELLTWPNGDPKMQLEVTMQTTLRDASIEDDDGLRRLFVKGKNMTNAVREAVRSVGGKGLEVDGDLTVIWVRNGVAEKGMSPPREYEARYIRPNATAAFLGTAQPEAAPAAVVQPAGAAPEDALQAALANLSPEVKAALLAQAKAG